MSRPLLASSLGGLPIQLNPLARDFASMRAELIALVKSLTDEWTDFSPADPGVTLLEAVTYVYDVLSYLTDRVRNESYLLTAQERSSVVQILRLINYELQPGSAAYVGLKVVTSLDNVTIPAGTIIQSKATASTPSQTFEVLAAVVLPFAGTYTTSNAPGLVAVHGRTVTNEVFGTSTGAAGQRFTLAQSPLALNPDGSSPLVVTWDNDPWSFAGFDGSGRTFLGNEPTDKVFRWELDDAGRVTLRFGDGTNGATPPPGAVGRATYRVGGGAIGNQVGQGTLTVISPPIAGVTSVTNPLQPSGGAAPETLDHAKKYGPLSLRSLDRAVTLEDFETQAKRAPGGGVKAARAAHGRSPIEVCVYLLAQGSNPIPSGRWYSDLDTGTGLVGAVGRWLTQRKAVPTRLRVEPATAVRPHFEADVFVLPNILREDAKYEVNKNLVKLCRDVRDDFGVGVPLSEVIRVIENSRGVDYHNVKAFHRLPTARFSRGHEPAFLAATVTFGEFAPSMVADQYTIQWSNGTRYKLKGERGYVLNAAGNVAVFQAGVANQVISYPNAVLPSIPKENPQFTIQIDVDSGAYPRAGDEWLFGVDNYMGNLAVQPYEVVVATILPGDLLDPEEFVLTFGGGIG